MIIILEGPDGAGKSRLCDELRLVLSKDRLTHIFRHGPYKDISSEDLCKIYFRSMSQALTYDDHVILDRCWLSEPIYGAVYRKGANRVDRQRQRMLERCALSRGAVVIRAQPPLDVCITNFLSRKDLEYLDNTQQLTDVYDMYERLVVDKQTDLPVIHYDYTQDTITDLWPKIAQTTTPNKAAGGGCFGKGNTLMLCDKGPRTNVRASAAVVPFINFLDNDGPSRMLAETLEREGIPESKLYWINTQTHLGQPTTADFVQELAPDKVFALGNNAYTWALNNNIKAFKLPPPLYHMQNFPNQPYHITEADYGNSY